MVRQRYRIVAIIFMLLIVGHALAQQFNFDSHKKMNSEYNSELAAILRSNNSKKMRKLLEKKPDLVNAASTITTESKYNRLSSGKVPLLYDAIERCIDGSCSFEMVEQIFNFNPNLYCEFEGKTVFYFLLDYISEKTIEDCTDANKIALLFLNDANFNLANVPADFPPPLSYLLSKNLEHLGMTYPHDYILNDLIELMVEKGSSINTRDLKSNVLVSFAIRKNDPELIQFCIGKNPDFTVQNETGNDPLYYAVECKNNDVVKTITSANYPLNEIRLLNVGINEVIHSTSNVIIEHLSDLLLRNNKTLTELELFSQLFPQKKTLIISNLEFRNKIIIERNDIPKIVVLFQHESELEVALQNIKNIKYEYIHTSDGIDSFMEAISLFQFYQINEYTPYFYRTELTSQKIYNEINTTDQSIPLNLKERLLSDILIKTNEFYSKCLSYYGIAKLYDLSFDFPSKKENIEKHTFEHFIYKKDVSIYTTWSINSIQEQKNKILKVFENIIEFNNYFNESTYALQVMQKMEECEAQINSLSIMHDLAVQRIEDLKNSYSIIQGGDYCYLDESASDPYSEKDRYVNIRIIDGGLFSTNVERDTYFVSVSSNNGEVKTSDNPYDDSFLIRAYDNAFPVVVLIRYQQYEGDSFRSIVIKLYNTGTYTFKIF